MQVIKRQGFTLIEMMITLALIAVLSSGTLLISVTTNLKRGRDGTRKAHLEATRSALEIYKSDNGSYPTGTAALVPGYMASALTDPSAGRSYGYSPAPAGCNGVATKCTSYTLCAALEQVSTVQAGCASCGSACTYKTTNP